ncbi:MAG: glycosyltransferase [Bacteroidota bacterium]|nr:glycosyltransferase [Bacteroidota bacterium]
MTNPAKVSIIVTSYNYSSYLRNAIDSALMQTYPHIEVIVVDDGSTDHSAEIILGYNEKIIPVLKQNGGQASAFNAGFIKCSGDIILFLDSDDVLHPSAVEKIIPLFQGSTVAKVHWILNEINGAGKATGKVTPSLQLSDGDLRDEVFRIGPSASGGPPHSPPTSGNAWSRMFLSQVLPIPEAEYITCTDQYLQTLAPVYGRIRAIEQELGSYRIHGNNYSLNPLEKYMNEFLTRFESSCRLLHQHLLRQGIESDPSVWLRDSWFHRINKSLQEILVIVPEGGSFILVDANDWGVPERYHGRRRLQFIDQQGAYWGPPETDEHAIAEVKQGQQSGVQFIFFTWTTFWYLDYYADMTGYLRSYTTLVIKNERLIGFNLLN